MKKLKDRENIRPVVNIEYEIDAGGRRLKKIQEDLNDALEKILTEQSDKITSLNFKILNATS